MCPTTKTLDIKADGKPLDYELKDLPLSCLEFDPENPRIGYYQDIRKERGETATQKEIMLAIKAGDMESYHSLMESIEANNGVLYEIWVYPKNDGKYVIIDGNTRVTIYNDLYKKNSNNPAWSKIPAKILPSDPEGRAIDYIRLTTHLQSINNWQTYERARYVHLLYNERGYDLDSLKQKTKLSTNQIKKWLQAFSDMEEQFLPMYAESLNNPLSKFSHFVEYNDQTTLNGMKKNGLNISDFCRWVGDEEIKKAQDVRLLSEMLADSEISEILKTQGFSAAQSILLYKQPAHASKLFDQIKNVISGIKKMPYEDILEMSENPDSAKREIIIDLYKQVESLSKQITR